MARNKKEFSKEAMYKKIMPSSMLKSIEESDVSQELHEILNTTIDEKTTESDIKIANIGKKIISDLKKIENKVYDENDPIIPSSNLRKNSIGENYQNNIEEDKIHFGNQNEIIDDIQNSAKETHEIEEIKKIENNEDVDAINNVKEKEIVTTIQNVEEPKEEPKTVNLMEIMVRSKLENVLSRFKINNKNVSKDDIINLTLNNLPIYLFKGTSDEINDEFEKFKQENNFDIVSSIIKSIIALRNNK